MAACTGQYLSKWSPKPAACDPELLRIPGMIAFTDFLSKNFLPTPKSDVSLMSFPDEILLRILQLVATLLSPTLCGPIAPEKTVISHHLFKARTINKRLGAIGATVFGGMVQKHGLERYRTLILPPRLPLGELEKIPQWLSVDMKGAIVEVCLVVGVEKGITLQQLQKACGSRCIVQHTEHSFRACVEEAARQRSFLELLSTKDGRLEFQQLLCTLSPAGRFQVKYGGALYTMHQDSSTYNPSCRLRHGGYLTSDALGLCESIMAGTDCLDLTVLGHLGGALVENQMQQLQNWTNIERLHLNLDSDVAWDELEDFGRDMPTLCPKLKHFKLTGHADGESPDIPDVLHKLRSCPIETLELDQFGIIDLAYFDIPIFCAVVEPTLKDVRITVRYDLICEVGEAELDIVQELIDTATTCCINRQQIRSRDDIEEIMDNTHEGDDLHIHMSWRRAKLARSVPI